MHPVIRAIGKILRLVGISSPEDSEKKPSAASDPPSWRSPSPTPTVQSPIIPNNEPKDPSL